MGSVADSASAEAVGSGVGAAATGVVDFRNEDDDSFRSEEKEEDLVESLSRDPVEARSFSLSSEVDEDVDNFFLRYLKPDSSLAESDFRRFTFLSFSPSASVTCSLDRYVTFSASFASFSAIFNSETWTTSVNSITAGAAAAAAGAAAGTGVATRASAGAGAGATSTSIGVASAAAAAAASTETETAAAAAADEATATSISGKS